MSIHLLFLIKLLAAHLLADFCFQPKLWVEKKRENNLKFHVIHAVLHATLAYVFVATWKAWYIPLSIGISHFIIDYWKSSQKQNLTIFIIDQFLHLTVIFTLWLCICHQGQIIWHELGLILNNRSFWIYITGFIFILKPTSTILFIATQKWAEERGEQGLKDAGQWIGYLERILILIFMCLEVYEAIGFILAAKSIYRFGELKEAKDVKKTEYIMIGTFLSFTIAIVLGIIINHLI